jgi:L-gulonolactone oxidase
VNTEERYVIAQAGITLNDLHGVLAAHNLAMSNLGAISEQTLGGIIATATHGSGTTYPVLSTYVLSLTLLLADGSRQVCTRTENTDLFMASLCSLGVTGLLLTVKLAVEPAFKLREVQTPVRFDEVLGHLDGMAIAAEHVKLWWFPVTDTVIWSKASRTYEVGKLFWRQSTEGSHYSNAVDHPSCLQPKSSAGSWFWGTLLGYHTVQFLLYVGRFFPGLNIPTGKFAAWLASTKSVRVDDSYKIFNMDCRVRAYYLACDAIC